MPERPEEEGGAPPPRRGGLLARTHRRVVVRDESMLPALRPGDRLLVALRAYRERAPGVGEIVVLVDPEAPGRWLVKRVAAVGPGPGPVDEQGRTPELPPGTVYVTGDNPARARDSRRFGPVALSALVGRAVRRYAPADRIGDL